MQPDGELQTVIQYIKWYYSGKTVQEILNLHEKNFSNFVTPTERKIKWWILLFETKGCINATHFAKNISDSDIDKVPDIIDISTNLNFIKCEIDTVTNLANDVDLLESNWEKNDIFNVDNDTKEGIIEIEFSEFKCENIDYENNTEDLNENSGNATNTSPRHPNHTNADYLHLSSTSKNVRIRKQHCCLFCKKRNITNFHRHLYRNHLSEPKVQEAFALPLGSFERKEALKLLRNKGNFEAGICQAVRRVSRYGTQCNPCPYCLGYFSVTSLVRHRKKCRMNFIAANAQEIQARDLNVDPILLQTVFRHMRDDYETFIAKNDLLICDFGAYFHHNQSTLKNINNRRMTSCRMRQLAKVVIELRSRNSQLNNLIDLLKPTNYDLLVAAVWKLANFDWEKNHFYSPNFAICIGRSLRKCCEIAIENVSKYDKTGTITLQDLSEFLKKFHSQWKQDVLNAAMSSLPVKKTVRICDNLQQNTVTVNLGMSEERNRRRYRYTINKPWTQEQKDVVLKFFRNHILQKKPPKSRECQYLKNRYPKLLENKNWQNIKAFVQHKYSYVTKTKVIEID